MSLLRTTFISPALTFLILGCSSPDAPDTSEGDRFELYGLVFDRTTSVMITGWQSEILETSNGPEGIETPVTFAYFNDGTNLQPDVGSVLFNSDTLRKQTDSDGNTSYSRSTLENVLDHLPYDGTPVRFTVTGSDRFPGLTMNVPSPIGPTRLVNPRIDSLIERTSPYTIEWSSEQPADTAWIWIFNELSPGQSEAVRYRVSDNGQFTVPVDDLQQFSYGPATIAVVRINWREETISGRKVLCMVISEERVKVMLK